MLGLVRFAPLLARFGLAGLAVLALCFGVSYTLGLKDEIKTLKSELGSAKDGLKELKTQYELTTASLAKLSKDKSELSTAIQKQKSKIIKGAENESPSISAARGIIARLQANTKPKDTPAPINATSHRDTPNR